ncbi:MAG: hypothetical protein JSS64_02815 [Bacteroidetes bacterium]|nr:hypothetical protein [Bacteroidota bacterium]
MENFEERWQKVENLVQERFGKKPDMEAILFLIGMNELGQMPPRNKWTKEQKQDLMHIAVCKLLSSRGHYRYIGSDPEGWPHYEEDQPIVTAGMPAQEQLLKECVIEYLGIE